MSRFRHYVNLSRTAPRLERLLRDFAWDRMDRVYAETLASTPRAGRSPSGPMPTFPAQALAESAHQIKGH
jgi:hypothetical protein